MVTTCTRPGIRIGRRAQNAHDSIPVSGAETMAEHITSDSLLIVGPSPTRRVEWTVRDYARREQVDERTVRRWIVKGAVHIRRTAGGRVRIIEG